jgi:hypothetical protein
MRQQSLGFSNNLVADHDRITGFRGLDDLPWIARVFEFGAPAAQGREVGELGVELRARRVFDGEVAAALSGAQALLGQQSDEGESAGVVCGDVGSGGVTGGDRACGGQFGAGIRDPGFPGGLGAGDLLQLAGG